MNKEFWAGMIVLASLFGGFAFYTVQIVDTAVTEYHTYTLDASNVTGIEIGTPVVMAGYNMGKVTKIDVLFQPSLRFEVEMSVKPEIPIPSNVTAQMGTRLAGGGLINLVPPEEITTFLEEGARLTLAPSTDIQSLLDSADSLLKDLAIITARGRGFVEDPEQGLELRLKEVDKILVEVNTLLDELTAMAQSSNSLLRKSSPVVAKTLSNSEALTAESLALMTQMDKSLKEFDVQMTAMGELMEGYDPDRNQEMQEIFKSLNASSTSLQQLMTSMEASPLKTIRKGIQPSSSTTTSQKKSP